MALDTYANLQLAVAKWLARETDTDLATQIPDFIDLAEAEMMRRLRRTSVRGTLTINAEAVTIPAGLAQLRSISLITGSPSQDVPLRMGTPEMLAERKARSAGVAGRPTDVAIMGGSFVFAPPPDATYTANIFYYAQLTPLSASNTTNTILNEAPDAYLFGALLQAEPYLEHDDRLALWQSKFDNAIDQLNEVRDREEHTASIQAVRLPVVFG